MHARVHACMFPWWLSRGNHARAMRKQLKLSWAIFFPSKVVLVETLGYSCPVLNKNSKHETWNVPSRAPRLFFFTWKHQQKTERSIPIGAKDRGQLPGCVERKSESSLQMHRCISLQSELGSPGMPVEKWSPGISKKRVEKICIYIYICTCLACHYPNMVPRFVLLRRLLAASHLDGSEHGVCQLESS